MYVEPVNPVDRILTCVLLLPLVATAGCEGPAGPAGHTVSVTPANDEQCTSGGLEIRSGPDMDGDGAPDPGAASHVICEPPAPEVNVDSLADEVRDELFAELETRIEASRSVPHDAGTASLSLRLSNGALELLCNGHECSEINPGFAHVLTVDNGLGRSQLRVTTPRRLEATALMGHQFDTTPERPWATPKPFFLYAVNGGDTDNDGVDDDVRIALSPNPRRASVPGAEQIARPGAPAGADASSADIMFFWDDEIEPEEYAGRPAFAIGGFRMTNPVGEGWQVVPLSPSDGIGRFHQGRVFEMPQGQMGAAEGTHLFGPLEGYEHPTFVESKILYTVGLDGYVDVRVDISGDDGTPGAGTGDDGLFAVLPYRQRGDALRQHGPAQVTHFTTDKHELLALALVRPGEARFSLTANVGADLGVLKVVGPADFGDGSRSIIATLRYPAF